MSVVDLSDKEKDKPKLKEEAQNEIKSINQDDTIVFKDISADELSTMPNS